MTNIRVKPDNWLISDAVPGLALTAGAFILPVGTPRPTFTAPNSWWRGGQRTRGRGGGSERPAGGEEKNSCLLVLQQGRRRGMGRTLHCWLCMWEEVNPIRFLFRFSIQGTISRRASTYEDAELKSLFNVQVEVVECNALWFSEQSAKQLELLNTCSGVKVQQLPL